MPKHKRHGGSGHKLFGYIIINRDWLIWYGKQNDCVPDIPNLSASELNKLPEDWDTTIVSNAVDKILIEFGFYATSTLMEGLYEGKSELCITLATNKYGMVAPLAPERWQRLKEILGVDRDPRWYPAYDDD